MSQILIVASSLALRWSFSSSMLSKFWNNLTALQAAAVISALILTIGAIIEYWYKIELLVLLSLKWIVRRLTPLDRCVFKKLLIHSFGPILVVLGIAGELVFEGRTFIVEDKQEEQARKTVGTLGEKAEEADVKARTAISDSSTALLQAKDALAKAGKAQESLGKAEDKANRAQGASSNALNIANDAKQVAHEARVEADSFERDIVSAKTQAADAESHLADALQRAANAEADIDRLKMPRSLIHKDELVAALKHFHGTEYKLSVFADDEAATLTEAIGKILEEARWVRKQPENRPLGLPYINVFSQDPKDSVPACLEIGIHVHVKAKIPVEVLKATPVQNLSETIRAADALRAKLALSISPSDERNVWSAIEVDKEPGEGPVSICVGKKP